MQNEPLLLAEKQDELEKTSSASMLASTPTYGQALKTLLLSTLPLTITTAVSFFNQTITLHFLKSSADIQILGAYSLGGTIMNILAMTIFISLNVGLTSKSAQAYGAKNYRLVGLYLHRGLIINMMLFIPFCCFFYFSDHLCLALGFEEQIAVYIQEYLSRAIPGLFAVIIFSTLNAYLNACNVFAIPGGIEIFACVLNWISNYLLIEKYGMGIKGAALSWNLMFIVALVILLIYLKFWNPVEGALFWFCRDSFRELWGLFKHEALIGSMIYLEWVAYEIIMVFAGRLDQVQLTALGITFTNLSLLFSIPISLADVVLTYVGNAVGEKNPEKAKRFFYAGVGLVCISVVFVEIYYIFFSQYVAQFYVEDKSTQNQVMEYFHILIIQVPPDFIQFVIASGLRALGKEKAGTILLLICYYGISTPLSYFFCYIAGYEGKGLLFGPMINAYIVFIGLSIIYKRLDLNKQIEIVSENMKEDDVIIPDAQSDKGDQIIQV